jgi:hypothetical protein
VTEEISNSQAPSGGTLLPAERYRDKAEAGTVHEGPNAVRNAAREFREKHGPQEAPVVERRYAEDAPKTRTLPQARDDLNLTRKVERAKELVNGGLSNREAANEVEAPEHIEVVPALFPEDESTTVGEAARKLAEWRAGKPQRDAAAAIDGEQAPAQEAEPSSERAEPEAPAIDPVQQEVQKYQQVRTAYEQLLPQQKELLFATAWAEFPEMRAVDSQQRYDELRQYLAATDPARSARFETLHLSGLQVQQQQAQLEKIRASEADKERKAYVERQDEIAEEKIPELKDPQKAQEFKEAARSYLNSVGVDAKELASLYKGEVKIDFRDARTQQIIADAARYRAAQAARKTVVTQAKPLPPVQRPGVSQPRGAGDRAIVTALEAKFNKTGNVRDAHKLLVAQRRAAARY